MGGPGPGLLPILHPEFPYLVPPAHQPRLGAGLAEEIHQGHLGVLAPLRAAAHRSWAWGVCRLAATVGAGAGQWKGELRRGLGQPSRAGGSLPLRAPSSSPGYMICQPLALMGLPTAAVVAGGGRGPLPMEGAGRGSREEASEVLGSVCSPVCVRVRAHCSTGRLHAMSGGAGGWGEGVKGALEPTGLRQDPGGVAGDGQGGTHTHPLERMFPLHRHTQKQRHTPTWSTHTQTHLPHQYSQTLDTFTALNTHRHQNAFSPTLITHTQSYNSDGNMFIGIQLRTHRYKCLLTHPFQEHRLITQIWRHTLRANTHTGHTDTLNIFTDTLANKHKYPCGLRHKCALTNP